MADDDEDFDEKVAFTFAQMDTSSTGAVNYMQLRKWISAQMKADDELEGVKGITDEMQEASTGAFATHKRESDDMLGVEEVAALLRALDLLKYMPEEVHTAPWLLPTRANCIACLPRLASLSVAVSFADPGAGAGAGTGGTHR